MFVCVYVSNLVSVSNLYCRRLMKHDGNAETKIMNLYIDNKLFLIVYVHGMECMPYLEAHYI